MRIKHIVLIVSILLPSTEAFAVEIPKKFVEVGKSFGIGCLFAGLEFIAVRRDAHWPSQKLWELASDCYKKNNLFGDLGAIGFAGGSAGAGLIAASPAFFSVYYFLRSGAILLSSEKAKAPDKEKENN